jgi:hypothetical protein
VDYGHGPASISIEGDVSRGHQYVPRARHMLANLLARMRVGGLMQGMDHWVLDEADGSYAYAIVAGSVRKVVIVVGAVESDRGGGVRAVEAQVPDFFSGVVIGGTIPGETPRPPEVLRMSSFWPTAACAELHDLAGGVQQSARLAVEPYSAFDELRNQSTISPVRYTQYVKLKPTMYSGLMRNVVQFLMGFGRQTVDSVYDKAKPRIPTSTADQPPTKYQKDVQTNGLQIRFDWRWFRTHGITRATDGTLWLVEIGNGRGVLAFRLPMNPVTKDPRFREKLDRLGDDAGLYALDHLGGWPTGESMPTSAVASWKRAGLVLELAPSADLTPFYSNGPYTSQLGWAFSPDGREAHNTCNGWDGDMQNSQHFAVSITIGAFREVDPPRRAASLKQRFRSLVDKDGYRDRYPAVMAKIDRMGDSDCDSYLARDDPADALFDALDLLELDPCASGGAHLSLVSRSPLYYPGKYQRMIKFPHPELGYLLSHDMRSSGPVSDTRCDATMHVFFAQGQLRYVKYFRDPRPGPENVHTDDFEDCMYVGTWHSHDETGPRAISPQMYSNDFDERQEMAGSTRDTVRTSVDLGYWRVSVQDDLTYPPRAWLFREKRFMYTFQTKVVNGTAQTAAVTVPFYDRCAYYFTSVVSSTSTQEFGGAGFQYLADPWFCETWRNFGGWTHNSEHPDKCCICVDRTVRSPAPRYDPGGYNGGGGACADFSDNGPWCFVCDDADHMVYGIPPPPLPEFPSTFKGPDYHRITHLVNDSEFSPLLIEDAHFNSLNYERYWFIPSPDPDSFITQYLDVTHNAFGEGNALKYYFQPNEGPIKTLGGPFPPSYDGENITFIGVVP